jgi:hypothetical protein
MKSQKNQIHLLGGCDAGEKGRRNVVVVVSNR